MTTISDHVTSEQFGVLETYVVDKLSTREHLDAFREEVLKRFEQVDGRLDRIDGRLDGIDGVLREILDRLPPIAQP